MAMWVLMRLGDTKDGFCDGIQNDNGELCLPYESEMRDESEMRASNATNPAPLATTMQRCRALL